MPVLKMKPEWTMGETATQVQTTKTSLPNGKAGSYKTVEIMCGVARSRSSHPVVRELALKILQAAGTDSQNYEDEARAIGNFVRSRVKYVRDINGVEQLHDPLTMIDQIKRGVSVGDCDDMSLLTATLLLSIGHQPFFRIVRYKGRGNGFQHIYVVVFEKNWGKERKRIVLDCILKRHPIGTEVPHAFGEDIRV